MKFTLLIVILGVFFCYGQSNNVSWGTVGKNDNLVFKDTIVVKSKFWQTVEYDVLYPAKGVISNRNISAIRAYDQKRNGKGARATIIDGGINHRAVTIRLKSIRGHGINFNLEIYTQ